MSKVDDWAASEKRTLMEKAYCGCEKWNITTEYLPLYGSVSKHTEIERCSWHNNLNTVRTGPFDK